MAVIPTSRPAKRFDDINSPQNDVIIEGHYFPISLRDDDVKCKFTNAYSPHTYDQYEFVFDTDGVVSASQSKVRCKLSDMLAGDYNVSLSFDGGQTYVDADGSNVRFSADCSGYTNVSECVNDRACGFCHSSQGYAEGRLPTGSCYLCNKIGDSGNCRTPRQDTGMQFACASKSWIEDKNPACCGVHGDDLEHIDKFIERWAGRCAV